MQAAAALAKKLGEASLETRAALARVFDYSLSLTIQPLVIELTARRYLPWQ